MPTRQLASAIWTYIWSNALRVPLNALSVTYPELGFQLGTANNQIAQLHETSETYNRDCNIAIRLLQQKPTQVISNHIETVSFVVVPNILTDFLLFFSFRTMFNNVLTSIWHSKKVMENR